MSKFMVLGPSRKLLSTLPVIAFCGILGALTLYSEIFLTNSDQGMRTLGTPGPMDGVVLSEVNRVQLESKLGTFIVQKIDGQWIVEASRSLLADSKAIEDMLQMFSKIRVKKVHDLNPLNLSNFSMDRPVINVELNTPSIARKLAVVLVNPISNSTYLMTDRQDVIYEIENLDPILGTLSVNSVLETRLMPNIDFSKLREIRYKGPRGRRFSVTKTGGVWYRQKKAISTQELIADIKDVTNQRYRIVLDSPSAKLKQALDKEKRYISFEYLFKFDGGQEKKLSIGRTFRTIPGISVDRRSSRVIWSTSHPYAMVIPKGKDADFELKPKNVR